METIRDSSLGQVIRLMTNNKYLRHPEEHPDFRLPQSYDIPNVTEEKEAPFSGNESTTDRTPAEPEEDNYDDTQLEKRLSSQSLTGVASHGYDLEQAITRSTVNPTSRAITHQITPSRTKDGVVLVDWYTTGAYILNFYDNLSRILVKLLTRAQDDPANPQNWSSRKKVIVTSVIK
jgi:DHA1 family multidrug resistance protein-like MFS transporter